MAVSHIKSDTIADFTGTITGFNSQGSTTTIAATDLVRPSDWNSAHNQFYTLTGNTTGNSTASGTNVIFAGSGGVSVGGSTGTIVISCPSPLTYSGFAPYADLGMVTIATSQGTLSVEPMHIPNVQFDRIGFIINNTNSSNSSGSHTLNFRLGIYTRNASTLSLVASQSTSYGVTHSGTAGSYSLYSGMRIVTMGMTTTLTEGRYWLAVNSNTTSGGANGSYSMFGITQVNTAFAGIFSVATNTTQQYTLGQGIYTASTTGIPGSIAFSHLRGSDSGAFRSPIVQLISSTV